MSEWNAEDINKILGECTPIEDGASKNMKYWSGS
jgi:hypothetical protein